jgi:hypothetical protein
VTPQVTVLIVDGEGKKAVWLAPRKFADLNGSPDGRRFASVSYELS